MVFLFLKCCLSRLFSSFGDSTSWLRQRGGVAGECMHTGLRCVLLAICVFSLRACDFN